MIDFQLLQTSAGAGGSRVKLRRHGTPSEFPIAPCCASSLALPIFGRLFKQLEYQEATLFLIGWCNPGSSILFGLLDQIFQKTSRQHRSRTLWWEFGIP